MQCSLFKPKKGNKLFAILKFALGIQILGFPEVASGCV